MSAEESQAIDLAEEINISARLTDLEQNYAELERDRKNWIIKATESKEQLQELQKEKETYHSTLCILKDELGAVKSELAKEKSSKVEAETIANNLREKACRVEAEADDLRGEIRFVDVNSFCVIVVSNLFVNLNLP
jgi:chromosome segregation ATPase